jgi:hypothetical protein
MWMLQERRQQRTSEREAALRFQLEHSRARGGLEALVLADQQGMIVASAGEAGICEELGAIAPLMSRAVMGMPLPPLLRGAKWWCGRCGSTGRNSTWPAWAAAWPATRS